MSRTIFITIFVFFAVLAASAGPLLKFSYLSDGVFVGVRSMFVSAAKPEPTPEVESREVRFVGDIMLGRHVETLMKMEGSAYPFARLYDDSHSYIWVGNFEGTMPDAHTQTENYTLSFSVDQKYRQALNDFGFTHLSLANNHSYDFGSDIFKETIDNLSVFETFGEPHQITDDSLAYIDTGTSVIGLMGLHDTSGRLDPDTLTPYIDELSANSDLQIAYIHWGEEYVSTHNDAQERLAHALIDAGVDVIIGHHPHVVQDIQMYDDKLIFYSLGNFIFDQYFETSVQEGLILGLDEVDGTYIFKLLPITSTDRTASPRLMTHKERASFILGLIGRSDPSLANSIADGLIKMRKE